MSGKGLRAAVGAVTADDNNAVNAVLAADLGTLGLSFFCTELRASGCTQNGSAQLDDTGYILGFHIEDLFVQKAPVASLDSFDLDFVVQSLSYYCADGRVHARGIAAARQDTNRLNLFIHGKPPCFNTLYEMPAF